MRPSDPSKQGYFSEGLLGSWDSYACVAVKRSLLLGCQQKLSEAPGFLQKLCPGGPSEVNSVSTILNQVVAIFMIMTMSV